MTHRAREILPSEPLLRRFYRLEITPLPITMQIALNQIIPWSISLWVI